MGCQAEAASLPADDESIAVRGVLIGAAAKQER
jgi:hypothetical protein